MAIYRRHSLSPRNIRRRVAKVAAARRWRSHSLRRRAMRDCGEQPWPVGNGDPLRLMGHATVESLHMASSFGFLIVMLLMATYLLINADRISRLPAPCLAAASNVFIAIALCTEQLKTRSRTCEVLGLTLQCVNLLALLVVPVAVILSSQSIPLLGAMLTLFMYVILFFKLVSYVIYNGVHRAMHPKNAQGTLQTHNQQGSRDEGGGAGEISYPWNLNLRDLYYFVAAPTLCYQINYPKTTHFQLSFFLARVGEVVSLFDAMVALVQQLILPEMQRNMRPIWELEASHFLEYILKLAVPTHFIWLIFSYWFFHSFLNALAELLYFADRRFYQDWWNTESILEFWTKWNRPAHNWLFYYVYMPLKRCGHKELCLQGAVFLISALFFEGLIAVPLRMYKFLIFTVMFSQFLLAWILEKVFGDRFGGYIVWLNVFCGIPLVVMLYFHDYYVQHSHAASI